MSVVRYRKKPVEVAAIQWTGDNTDEVKAFVGERQRHGGDEPLPAGTGECGFLLADEVSGVINGDAIVFDRFHDWVPLHLGDWVIRGVKGEFYPCLPDVFAQTYEPASGTMPSRQPGAGYNSVPDTLQHSRRVGELMGIAIKELVDRSTQHDLSKTEPPEVEIFNEFTPKLNDSTYGSDEYKAFLAAMGEGLAHHYAHNRHHPEFHGDGINDMTVVDLVEMLADWKAATERHTDGDLTRSLTIQRERFCISDQLAQILHNTAVAWGLLDEREVAES